MKLFGWSAAPCEKEGSGLLAETSLHEVSAGACFALELPPRRHVVATAAARELATVTVFNVAVGRNVVGVPLCDKSGECR